MATASKKSDTKKKTAKKAAATPAKTGEVAPARSYSPFEDFDRFFNALMPRRWASPFRWDWPVMPEIQMPFEGKMPHVDVLDRDSEIVVRAELPGVEKDDLDVSMTDNSVTIKATSAQEEKEEKGDYFRHEISRGSFARTVGLPGDVDGSKAKAKFKNGILELTLPKLAKSRRKRITVD